MNDDWCYDTEALNVLHEFHSSNFVVFVEGGDDSPFWDTIFAKAGATGGYFEDLDGIEELSKLIIPKILNEDARVIIACDLHHSPFLQNHVKHVRIVRTYGYSIENTMYCPNTISRVISKFCRDTEDRSTNILDWLNEFAEDSKPLLIYDIANQKHGKILVIFGDKCCRFLVSDKSHTLSYEKISTYLEGVKDAFSDEEVEECKHLVDIDSRELRYLIKGSFLKNGVVNYIKNTTNNIIGRRPVIPRESIYEMTVDGCGGCDIEDCQEFQDIKIRIIASIESLRE